MSFSATTTCDLVDFSSDSSHSCTDRDVDIEVVAIFVLGGPGAGKGTQCKKMSECFSNIVTLSTGQLLRNLAASGTQEGDEIARQMAEGGLVKINATEQLLMPEFIKYNKLNNDSKIIYLIDGFPRDMSILKDWQNGMKNKAIVPFIIEFVCDDDILKKRLLNRQMTEKSSRNDYDMEAIQKRIALFENETQEVINYFKKQNKYQKIDATQSVEKVFDSFCQLLDPIQQYFEYYSLSNKIANCELECENDLYVSISTEIEKDFNEMKLECDSSESELENNYSLEFRADLYPVKSELNFVIL